MVVEGEHHLCLQGAVVEAADSMAEIAEWRALVLARHLHPLILGPGEEVEGVAVRVR